VTKLILSLLKPSERLLVVGYDTFNSILKGDRDETKDPNDHYNVTVSLMVTRKRPIPKNKP